MSEFDVKCENCGEDSESYIETICDACANKSLDITKQVILKLESRIKELEAENKRLAKSVKSLSSINDKKRNNICTPSGFDDGDGVKLDRK